MTRLLSLHKRELSVAASYLALLALLAALQPTFFQTRFLGTWVASAPVLVAAIGMTLVILCRQIDISIGAQISACAVLAALLCKAGLPLPLAALLTILAGAAFGALNGLLVAFLHFPSIVATLATSVILTSALKYARQGQSVFGLPDAFQWFGAGQSAGRILLLLAAAAVLAVAILALRYLAAGRAIYAVGSDAPAARLAGLSPPRITFAVFTLMGALSGLAALLLSIRFAQVDANLGAGLELQVIAAVVVGGASISGGRGTLLGTLAGVALLGTLGAALGFLTNQPYWDRALQGAIILTATASNALPKRQPKPTT